MRPTLMSREDQLRTIEAARYRDAYGDFLSRFKWDLYATPSFKWPVSYHQARTSAHEFISHFGTQAYAVVAYETGPVGGRTHIHILLGGLVGEIAKTHAGRLWKRGDITIEKYDPRRGACWYLPKTFYDNPDAGEIIGELKTLRRRKRGRRKRSNT